MGHDYVDFAGRSVVFRDPMLNLVRCIMFRLATEPSTEIADAFRPRLQGALRDFYYICNGVFSDFKLDDLIPSSEDLTNFLDFLDVCADYVVANGPTLRQGFLNELVGDSDDWNCDVNIDYPLLGIGRLANLVTGAENCVPPGALSSWAFDDVSPRMKQERLSEHRKKS